MHCGISYYYFNVLLTCTRLLYFPFLFFFGFSWIFPASDLNYFRCRLLWDRDTNWLRQQEKQHQVRKIGEKSGWWGRNSGWRIYVRICIAHTHRRNNNNHKYTMRSGLAGMPARVNAGHRSPIFIWHNACSDLKYPLDSPTRHFGLSGLLALMFSQLQLPAHGNSVLSARFYDG